METFFGAILLLIGIALSVSFIAVGKKMIYAMVPYTGQYFTKPAVAFLAFLMMGCLVFGATMTFGTNEIAIGILVLFLIPGSAVLSRKLKEAAKEFDHMSQVQDLEDAYKPTDLGDENDIKKALK